MLKGLLKKGESGAPAALLGHPVVQDVLQKAAHLRADLIDQFDERFNGLAKKLKLATRGELKLLRRQIRELENQVANLEHQLAQERARAERADDALADATRGAKKAQEARAAAEAALRDVETKLQALQAEAAARTEVVDDKPASRKAPRARKKAENNDEAPAVADEGGEAPAGETLL